MFLCRLHVAVLRGMLYNKLGGDTVPVSETKRRNNDKYNAACDRIVIQPKKEIGQEIRDAAEAAGQSLQGYILQAVRERMEREGRI